MSLRRACWLWLAVVLLVASGGCLFGSSSESPRSSQGPQVHTVPASIAADCSKPVDEELNRFLASVPNHSEIRFPRNGCYAQERTLTLSDRVGLTIDGNGSTFKAVSVGDDTRANWRAQAGSDITFKNITVRGVHPGFDQERLGRENHVQHGFSFDSVQGGALLDSRALDVDGDPVSFQPDTRRGSYCLVPPARNIVVDRFHAFNAARTVGLTHADNITIRRSYFGDIHDAAIDIETDTECEWSRNIRILDNRFGRHHFATLNYVGSEPMDRSGGLEFSGNVVEAEPLTCFPPIYFEPSWGAADRRAFYENSTRFNRSNIIIRNNRLNTAGDGMKIDYAGDARIEGNTVTSYGRGACGNRSAGGQNHLVALSDSDRVNVYGNRALTAANGEALAGELWTDEKSTEITQRPPAELPPPAPLPPAPPDGDKERIPPAVQVSDPPADATVSGTVRFTVVARDRNATDYSPPGDGYGQIIRVEFSLDGQPVGMDGGPNYTYAWDTAGAAAGPHTFTATAVDGNDNRGSTSITVIVAPP